eukprot:154104-Prorocentrum_minimum.AAC.2
MQAAGYLGNITITRVRNGSVVVDAELAVSAAQVMHPSLYAVLTDNPASIFTQGAFVGAGNVTTYNVSMTGSVFVATTPPPPTTPPLPAVPSSGGSGDSGGIPH